MLNNSIDENFMKPIHRDIWKTFDDPEKVIEAILTSEPWSKDAIKFA
jgi:hypothetical protein